MAVLCAVRKKSLVVGTLYYSFSVLALVLQNTQIKFHSFATIVTKRADKLLLIFITRRLGIRGLW